VDLQPHNDSPQYFKRQTITWEIDTFQSLGRSKEVMPRSWAVSGRPLSTMKISRDVQLHEWLNTTRWQCGEQLCHKNTDKNS